MPLEIANPLGGRALSLRAMLERQRVQVLRCADGGTLTVTGTVPRSITRRRVEILGTSSMLALSLALRRATAAIAGAASAVAASLIQRRASVEAAGQAETVARSQALRRASAVIAAGATATFVSEVAVFPAQFGTGGWDLQNDGANVTLQVLTLPDDGGSAITDLEYRVNGGSAVSLGAATTGDYTITASEGDTVNLRAVNAVGAGDWSGNKTVPAASFLPTSLADLVVWADIHPAYCFQNSDGTGACVVDDPVGYVVDRSGNGYHLTQATSTARPVLRQTVGGKYYLDFDGVDDHLLLPAAATSGTTVLDTVLGIDADATVSNIFGMYDGPSNYLFIAHFSSDQLRISGEVDPGGTDDRVNTATLSTGTPYIWRSLRDGTNLAANLNGVSQGTASLVGTGGLANLNFALGARGRAISDNFFDGKVFGLVVVNRAMTSPEIADTEAFMADKTGVTL